MRKLLGLALAAVLLAGMANAADTIKRVGVTVGSLGNPGFVVMGEGVTQATKEKFPDAEVTVVSGDYDLSKQSQQMDDFIAAGMDVRCWRRIWRGKAGERGWTRFSRGKRSRRPRRRGWSRTRRTGKASSASWSGMCRGWKSRRRRYGSCALDGNAGMR